jgi:hypothetical protein
MRVTRFVTYSRKNFISEPTCSMANTKFDRLEQQNTSIQKILEGFIKLSTEKLSKVEERQQKIEDKLSNQGPSGLGDNSTIKNREKKLKKQKTNKCNRFLQ